MYTIYIKTYDWLLDLTADEIFDLTNYESKALSDSILEIKIDDNDDKDLFNFVYELAYYSRTIENVYLKVERDNSFLKMPKIDVDIDGKKVRVFDLVGFDLSKREYKINLNSDSINPLIVNSCFYLLGLDEEDKYSITDLSAGFGDVILEASLFHPRKALNVKDRHSLNIYKAFKHFRAEVPKNPIDKNKYNAVVQTDKEFSKLRENLNKSPEKIKVSKFELDWIDVKFKEEQFDFVMTSIPLFKDEKVREKFLDQFFYQAEYICKNAICVISREVIDKKFYEKHELELEDSDVIELNGVKYYIYIIS
jgi:hypothetical protein